MISTVRGVVRYKGPTYLVVDVAGIGYKIFVTTDVALSTAEGSDIFFWTHFAVRETAHDLYGFLEKESLDIFELLLSVSGIGPRTALSILNVATPSMLRQAVSEGDTSYITKVSGIGRKTADKIVLELRDKLGVGTGSRADLGKEADVYEALLSLGYGEREVREVLKKLDKTEKNTSERVKTAIKLLSNAR